jgi:hypothetical protein
MMLNIVFRWKVVALGKIISAHGQGPGMEILQKAIL